MRRLLFILLAGICWMQAFSQSGQLLPANSKIIYFGDSQTSFGYNSNGNTVQYQNYGYIAWVNALAPDVYMPADGMLGVPGETTSQMLHRLDALAPTGGKILVVVAGTNDPLYAITPETTEANLRKIYDAGIAAGMKVIAVTILPRFGSNAYNATNEANRKLINNWIKSQADVSVVDAETDLNDPQYFEDGLHNSPAGAYVLGSKVAAEVNKLVNHCLPGSLTVPDLAVASNSNPLLKGTGGRTDVAAGSVANSWLLAGNFAGNATAMATVTGAKETDANGKEKQVITISGTYSGSTRKVTYNNYAGGPISMTTGDVVEGVAELEVASAMTGIKAIYLNVLTYSADYSVNMGQGVSMWSTSPKTNYMPPGKYLLRTPPMNITGGGAVGQLTLQVVIEFINTTTVDPVSATLKFSSIGIRHLPLTVGNTATITPGGSLRICPDSTVELTASAGSSYQWNLDGTELAGATASVYSAKTPGRYTVTVGMPGCSILSDATVVNPSTDCASAKSLRTDTLPAALCAGQPVHVPFSKTGHFQADNVFTVQLSDGKGSFANPVVIGSRSDTSGSVIDALIPANIQPDTGYRIRVVSSSPAITGADNGRGLSINAALAASIRPADTVTKYPNLLLTLSALPQQEGYRYQWLRNSETVGEGGSSYEPTEEGDYRVVITGTGGCADTSKATVVRLGTCPQLHITVASSDASVFTVNASGGHAPYQFSLDSVNYQNENTFTNLTAGRDYTVYVKDSAGCTGQLTFTIKDSKNCDAQQWIGSSSTSFATQNLGSTPGLVVVTYELLPLPDQIDIFYNDSTVVTTRNVADSMGWLWFQYSPPTTGPDKFSLRMQRTISQDQTAWKYTALCPLNQYRTMVNAEDTTANTVFVSPNFPNAYPGNTSWVQTFTPGSAGARLHVDFKALLLSDDDSLYVYDGADTLAPLLAVFSGNYAYGNNPSLVATNRSGQLTFRFAAGAADGKYGWVSSVYYRTSVDSFFPQQAKMGDTVVIHGAGFTGTTAVLFGGIPALSYAVLNDTSIRAIVGAGLSGDVEVISALGVAARAGFVFVPEVKLCPNASLALVSGLQGESYQWQVSTDSVRFVNITGNEEYSGVNSATLQLMNLSSSHYGYQYRCVVDGTEGKTYTVRFVNEWVGSVSSEWENAANWGCGVLPDANTDVIINTGSVILNSKTAVRSLTAQAGTKLTLGSKAELTLTR